MTESSPGEKGDGGRPASVSDEDILEVFVEADQPALGTSEVAEQIPLGRRQVQNRLNELHARGKIECSAISSQSHIWWRPGYTSTTNR